MLTEKTASSLSPALISATPWQTSTAVKPAAMVCSVFELATSWPFCRIHIRTLPLPAPSLLPTCAAAITKYVPASLKVTTPLEWVIPFKASSWLSVTTVAVVLPNWFSELDNWAKEPA